MKGGERRGRGPSGSAPRSEVKGVERKGGAEEENGGRELRWEESGDELGPLELGKVPWSKEALGSAGVALVGLRTREE